MSFSGVSVVLLRTKKASSTLAPLSANTSAHDATHGFFLMVELVTLLGRTIHRKQHRVTGAHNPLFESQMTQLKRLH